MDILGFIATIIICITVVISVALFLKHPIRFKITHENVSSVSQGTSEKLETQENVSEQEIEQPEIVCMDAVVQAANELMGIQTFKKEDEE